MTVTISRLYDTYAAAAEAVRNLEAAGIPHNDISIVSNNSDNWYANSSPNSPSHGTQTVASDERPSNAGTGVGLGATAGGLAGLLAGLGLIAILASDPVVAAGWLVVQLPSRCCSRRGLPGAS